MIAFGIVCRLDAQVKEMRHPSELPQGYYLTDKAFVIASIVPPAPEQGSSVTMAELKELHQIQTERSLQQVKAAQKDDTEEDIFIFRDVMGEGFRENQLPLTAELSKHIHDDESFISRPLKARFRRPRPYQWDKTLNAVCKLSEAPNSYPSGHSISGYLEAFTLMAMFPEKASAIMARADAYAHNRLVCGVHYSSDIGASRVVATATFGYMVANPKFEADLNAAKAEIDHQREITRSHPSSTN
jgi:acid phosphatase (class A)